MKADDSIWAKETLEYTDQWIKLGILTSEVCLQQRQEWSKNDADRNTEHYRFGAWQAFWGGRKSISNEHLKQCILLAASESDPSLGNAILHDMLKTHWLGDEQFLMVSDEITEASEKKIVERYALLRSAKADPSLENLDRIAREGHTKVQRDLIDSYPLKQSTLEFLEAHGAAREVRNLARQELLRRKARG